MLWAFWCTPASQKQDGVCLVAAVEHLPGLAHKAVALIAHPFIDGQRGTVGRNDAVKFVPAIRGRDISAFRDLFHIAALGESCIFQKIPDAAAAAQKDHGTGKVLLQGHVPERFQRPAAARAFAGSAAEAKTNSLYQDTESNF